VVKTGNHNGTVHLIKLYNNINVSYYYIHMENPNFIFIVYTCRKNLDKAELLYKRYLNGLPLIHFYKIQPFILYGDETMNSDYIIKDNKYLVVKTKDDYHSLSLKTLRMCKVIYARFPSIRGMFKCDDDMILNHAAIENFIHSSLRFPIHYSGNCRNVLEKQNNIAHVRNKDTNLVTSATETITTPAAIYCGGPLYYLSHTALEIVNNIQESIVSNIYYEDLMIGYILNSSSMYPIHSQNIYTDNIKLFNDPASFHNTYKKNSIFLRIQGGLGNQLFQIAAGFGIAEKNNMNLFIINTSDMKQTFTHVDDNNTLLNGIFENFPKIHMNAIQLDDILQIKEKEDDCFTYTNITPACDIFLDGYYQNEKYFREDKKLLFSMLKSTTPYRQFMEKIERDSNLVKLLKRSYFIHVRRGDYLKLGNLYKIDNDKYYKLALKRILSKEPQAHFIIFSDDIEYCKAYSVFSKINKYYMDTSPLETLFLMSCCVKGGICGNSTFSWWGSYLNENPNKFVTFPSKWINKDWNNDIYYEGSTVIQI